jgi:hypothetical protein
LKELKTFVIRIMNAEKLYHFRLPYKWLVVYYYELIVAMHESTVPLQQITNE